MYAQPLDMPEPLKLPVTAEWRKAVDQILRERGHGARQELAAEVGCQPSAISKLINGRVKASELVAPISDALGIVQMSPDVVTRENYDTYMLIRDLDAEDLEMVQAVVHRLARRRE